MYLEVDGSKCFAHATSRPTLAAAPIPLTPGKCCSRDPDRRREKYLFLVLRGSLRENKKVFQTLFRMKRTVFFSLIKKNKPPPTLHFVFRIFRSLYFVSIVIVQFEPVMYENWTGITIFRGKYWEGNRGKI